MRIVALADTHGMHYDVKVPDGDILIHAGDFCNHGVLSEVIEFNNWLRDLPHKMKVVIAGNHDVCFDKGCTGSSSVAKLLLSEALYLENSGYCGLEDNKEYFLWGSPMTPTFNDWAFMEDRDKIDRYWSMIPKKTDILVTHGPAYGVLDKVPLTYMSTHSVGCEGLLEKINKVKPKIHIFGHIHASYGITKIKDTVFVNCSICNEEYDIVNEPVVIDI